MHSFESAVRIVPIDCDCFNTKIRWKRAQGNEKIAPINSLRSLKFGHRVESS